MHHSVTLLTRVGCTTCAAAEADVRRICDELDVPWSNVDVDEDPELRAEYGDRVPVILVDGHEHGYWAHGYWAVEEDRLRRALSR